MLWWPGIGFCVRGFARPWAGGCLLWHNVSSFLLFGITLCQEAPCTQEGAACFVEYHTICNTNCALFALIIAVRGLLGGVGGFDSRLAHHVGAKSAPLRFKAVPYGAALKLRSAPLLLLSNSNPLRWASSRLLVHDDCLHLFYQHMTNSLQLPNEAGACVLPESPGGQSTQIFMKKQEETALWLTEP